MKEISYAINFIHGHVGKQKSFLSARVWISKIILLSSWRTRVQFTDAKSMVQNIQI